MEDISIDFLREVVGYSSEFADVLRTHGEEAVRGEILALVEKDNGRMQEWDRTLTDIRQTKQKIAEQDEEIRKRLETYPSSNAEYDEIMADADIARRELHLRHFLEERAGEIRGVLIPSGSLDKRAHRMNLADEMLEMRKDMYVDRKNIAEALSLALIENDDVRRMMRAILEKNSAHDSDEKESGTMLDAIFEQALKTMLEALLRMEKYQRDGLLAIRHLEELDRQVVYMLVMMALKKHK